MSNYTYALHINMIFQESLFNFLFNEFDPYSHDISITKYFSWKFKFTLNINLPFYPLKPSNFYFPHFAKVRDVTIYPTYKNFILEIYLLVVLKRWGYWAYTSTSLSYVTSSYDWSFHKTFTNRIIFVLNTRSILSKTAINCSS